MKPERFTCKCGQQHDRLVPERPAGVNRTHRRDAYRLLDAAARRDRQVDQWRKATS